MEEKIRNKVITNIRLTVDALIASMVQLMDNSPDGAIGAILDEENRISNTIDLLRVLRDFKA